MINFGESRVRLNILRDELKKQVTKLREEVVLQNIEKEVGIDQLALDTEMQKQSGYMYYYSSMLASRTAIREGYKVYVDFLEAVLDEEIRNELALLSRTDSTVKITEPYVKAAITRNSELVDAELELVRLKRDEALLDSIVKSFEHKKDMLVSLAANMRARMQSEINI